MKRRQRLKPRGQLGYVRLGSGVTYHSVPLPSSKEEIEQWMLDRALRAASKKWGSDPYALAAPPVRNPEADFDFTLPTASGPQYLDLMEIVVLPEGAKGHEHGRLVYDAEGMAEAVFAEIADKSKHYGGGRRSRPHLLLYATDWRFRLLEQVVQHLVLFLSRRRHAFATVVYFGPYDEESGEIIRLYPADPDTLGRYAEAQLAARHAGSRKLIILFDPRTARLEGSGRVMFENPLSKKRA